MLDEQSFDLVESNRNASCSGEHAATADIGGNGDGASFGLGAARAQVFAVDQRKPNAIIEKSSFVGANISPRVQKQENVSYQGCKVVHKHYHQTKSGPANPVVVEGMTWLLPGKFGLFNKQPLHITAKVYLGRQYFHQGTRDVAVKLVEHRAGRDREVSVLMKLQHPNVVQVIDFGEYELLGHWIYIIMELCSESLYEYIIKHRIEHLDYPQCMSFSKQILEGLVYLHKKNIIHRDLKPSNILISEQCAKVSDFGISKELAEGQLEATNTSAGLGTEGYMAPEILLENRKVSCTADIYSYGIVISVLFSQGSHPFGSNQHVRSANIIQDKAPDFGIFANLSNKPFRTRLLHLLQRTLRHKPGDRPSARELLDHELFSIDDVSQHNSSKRLEPKSTNREAKENPPKHNPKDPHSADLLLEHEFFSDIMDGVSQRNPRDRMKSKPPNVESKGNPSNHNPKDPHSADQVLEHEMISAFVPAIVIIPPIVTIKIEMLEANMRPVDQNLKNALDDAAHELDAKRGKFPESVERVREIIFMSRESSVEEICQRGEDFIQKRLHAHALILCQIASYALEIQTVNTDRVAAKVMRLCDDIYFTISLGCTPQYGKELLHNLSEYLRGVLNVNPDAKAIAQAKCLRYLAQAYSHSDDDRKMVEYDTKGWKIFRDHFGADASMDKMYGRLLMQMGDDYSSIGKYAAAQLYYVRAVAIFESARYFQTKDDRTRQIDQVKRNLDVVRFRLSIGSKHT